MTVCIGLYNTKEFNLISDVIPYSFIIVRKGGKIDSITPWNGAVFVASTNLTFKANDAEIKINNDGVNKHLFLYTDIDGYYKAVVVGDGEPEPWTKYAKMTVNFLENISSDEMSVSAGTYYLGSTGKVGNGEWNRLEDNVGYGKNKPFVFKYAQESTLNIGGATLTLPCDGSASDPVANYSIYYYNGEYYNTKEEAEAKYEEDHPDQPTNPSISVDISKNNITRWSNEHGQVDVNVKNTGNAKLEGTYYLYITYGSDIKSVDNCYGIGSEYTVDGSVLKLKVNISLEPGATGVAYTQLTTASKLDFISAYRDTQ